MKRRLSPWLHNHLICEFDHNDCCLSGLVEYEGEKYYCKIINWEIHNPYYYVYPIKWDTKCDEYLDDYKAAYPWWFYNDGKRGEYDGREFMWFRDKWKGRSPIVENSTGVING